MPSVTLAYVDGLGVAMLNFGGLTAGKSRSTIWCPREGGGARS